jgi:putative transposase
MNRGTRGVVRTSWGAPRHGTPIAPVRVHDAWQNGAAESFNGKLRDECLSMQWFKNRVDATVLIEDWRTEYNTVRPHSSLGSLTPAAFAERMTSTVQQEAIF